MENVLSAAQNTQIIAFLTKVFNGVMSLIYTVIDTVVTFLTTPAILGTLATMALIYLGYGWIKRKRVS